MRPPIHLMIAAGMLWLVPATATAQPWSLPAQRPATETGPRTYRFVVHHTVTTTTGQVVQRQRISGDYTRGLPDLGAVWHNVTVAESNGPGELTAAGEKRGFMEGFSYRRTPDWLDDAMTAEFFKDFPPTAVFERNLVWDTGMLELFGQEQFDHLRLNTPYRVLASQDVEMSGIGRFHNREVYLTWVGRSRRNGEDCAVIEYRAFFNPVEVANGSMTLNGRSHYWGEIWVSLATRQIEYATLREDVLGELTLAGQSTPQVISVFRDGVFEPTRR